METTTPPDIMNIPKDKWTYKPKALYESGKPSGFLGVKSKKIFAHTANRILSQESQSIPNMKARQAPLLRKAKHLRVLKTSQKKHVEDVEDVQDLEDEDAELLKNLAGIDSLL